MYETEETRPRALAVALDTGAYDAEASLHELAQLADTAGIEVICTAVQKKDTPDNATFVGPGKLREIAQLCQDEEIDVLLFDDELSPMQIRNIEQVAGLAPVDRTMLILDIFARNARTREGAVQVELAQQRYRLPRLAGAGVAMSRLGAGIGTRGPGESKLETDRRHIMRRIKYLQQDLRQIEAQRQTTHRTRQKSGIKTVALVGYTNVGKSTLLNALTGAEVLVENKLFATLDPTARKLPLPDGTTALLVDTVGFVSRLPHHLVQAFRSTLKESAYADLILQVCDLQADNLELQLATTRETLESLEIGETPILTVFNKCDNTKCIESLPAGISREGAVFVSARTGYNLDGLLQKIAELLLADYLPVDCLLPFSQAVLENTLREKGQLRQSEYLADGIRLVGSCPQEIFYLFAPYQREGAGE